MKNLDLLEKELVDVKNEFRVVVFGSARIKEDDEVYKKVFHIGKAVGGMGASIVTGGGPGLMEAANRGHKEGQKEAPDYDESQSIGIGIQLPFEESMNKHLDIKEEHQFFSSRLDTFMALSNVVVVTPGGIGTLLEFIYTLQLVQVGHICKTPIILIGKMWKDLVQWIKREVVSVGLASEEDLDVIHIVMNEYEAIALIKEIKDTFEDENYDYCLNWEKYKEAVAKMEEEK